MAQRLEHLTADELLEEIVAADAAGARAAREHAAASRATELAHAAVARAGARLRAALDEAARRRAEPALADECEGE